MRVFYVTVASSLFTLFFSLFWGKQALKRFNKKLSNTLYGFIPTWCQTCSGFRYKTQISRLCAEVISLCYLCFLNPVLVKLQEVFYLLYGRTTCVTVRKVLRGLIKLPWTSRQAELIFCLYSAWAQWENAYVCVLTINPVRHSYNCFLLCFRMCVPSHTSGFNSIYFYVSYITLQSHNTDRLN